MLALRPAGREKFPFQRACAQNKTGPEGPALFTAKTAYRVCVDALSCADCDSGSSPAPAAALPPIDDEEDELPPAAFEPSSELTPGQEHLLADGEDDVVLSVWL